jgi:FkbM family methyltransferase
MLTARQHIHSLVWAYRLFQGKTQPRELHHLRHWLAADDVAFDVGAHAGAWAYPLSMQMSHVYAFEALPYYAQVLDRALRVVGAQNVTVVNHAVTNERGTVSIVWQGPAGERLKGFTHIAGQDEGAKNTLQVVALSLDEFVRERALTRRIGLIKCDVEGYESKVIEGALQLIQRCRPIIFAEAQNSTSARYGRTSADLIQIMAAQYYIANVVCPDGSIHPVDAASYSGEGDILFCPA